MRQLLFLILIFSAAITALLDLPAPILAAAPAALQRQAGPAREIANQIIAAYGGAARVKEMRDAAMRCRGHMSVISGISGATNSFDCTTFSRGDKIRIETVVMDQPRIMAFDGKKSWTQSGDWVTLSGKTTAARIAEEVNHGLTALADLLGPGCKLELEPPATVHNKPCDVIAVTGSDGKPTTFFADKQNHIILKSQYLGTDPERGIPALQAVEYLDYRLTAGLFLPFKTVELSDSKPCSENYYDQIEILPAVEDKLFKMPPESVVDQVKENPVIVPFEFLANQVLIKVRLGGPKEYLFLVDTGASQCVIDQATATSLGPYSVSNFSITAGSKAIPLSYMTLANFSIGGVDLHDISALVSDIGSFSRAIGVRPNGIIGANVLDRFLVTLDYRDRKMILANPLKADVPPGAVVVPTSPIFGATALIVSGKLDGKLNLNLLVDTGAALNNLPELAAKPLGLSPVLPVGEIAGIDGHKISIGSAQLKSLKLGTLTVNKPVFVLSPADGIKGGASAGGMFTANGMGILGNPIWSRFRTTIDYRNECLILEPITPGNAVALAARLDQARLNFLKTNDIGSSLKDYQSLVALAESPQLASEKALALLGVANCYAEKFKQTRDEKFRSLSLANYEQARQSAQVIRNTSVEARVLSNWAAFYLDMASSRDNLIAAQALISSAAQISPTEPGVYIALALLSAKTNQVDTANKLIDQTLMLDPANWDGLWLKYQQAVTTKNLQEKNLVIAQLRRYYPQAAKVVALTRR